MSNDGPVRDVFSRTPQHGADDVEEDDYSPLTGVSSKGRETMLQTAQCRALTQGIQHNVVISYADSAPAAGCATSGSGSAKRKRQRQTKRDKRRKAQSRVKRLREELQSAVQTRTAEKVGGADEAVLGMHEAVISKLRTKYLSAVGQQADVESSSDSSEGEADTDDTDQ